MPYKDKEKRLAYLRGYAKSQRDELERLRKAMRDFSQGSSEALKKEAERFRVQPQKKTTRRKKP